jgi:hypothetical protein
MRRIRFLTVTMGVIAYLALTVSAADARDRRAPNLDCEVSGTTFYYSGTYDNVTVPPGQTCELSDATILGNVRVETSGSVTFEADGTVRGGVFVGQSASASEGNAWAISGVLAARDSGTVAILGTVRDVIARDVDTLSVQYATVDGDIVSRGGVFGGSITSSAISGTVVIDGTTGSSGAGEWFIGGLQENGAQQDIDRSLIVRRNQVPVYIVDNHIHRNLVCRDNTPPPDDSVGGYGNTVDGRSTGQCAPATAPAPAPARADRG